MFNYIAQGSWPEPQPQIDWVDQVESMESWLNSNIGAEQWRWVKTPTAQCTVAFKQSKHKTLFLLYWA